MLEAKAMLGGDLLEDLEGHGHDFGADTVTGQNGDAQGFHREREVSGAGSSPAKGYMKARFGGAGKAKNRLIDGQFPVAKNYPALALSHLYVDNAAMQMARDPNQFDVIVTENMFGDILSDEMAVVCGSLGMLASASLGAENNRYNFPFGLYEPAGGTAPDLAGKNLANPCAQILSVALLLRYSFGLEAPAAEIEKAVRDSVTTGTRTGDIAFGGKSVGTKEMGAAILARL